MVWLDDSLRESRRLKPDAAVSELVGNLSEPEPRFLSRYILYYVFLHEINLSSFRETVGLKTYSFLANHNNWHRDGEIAGVNVKPLPKKTSALAQIGLAYDICATTKDGRRFLALLTAAAALWLLQRRPFWEDLYDQITKEHLALHRNLRRIMSFCTRTQTQYEIARTPEGRPVRIRYVYPSLDILWREFGRDADQDPVGEPAAELKRSPSLPSLKELGSATPPPRETTEAWTCYHSSSPAGNRQKGSSFDVVATTGDARTGRQGEDGWTVAANPVTRTGMTRMRTVRAIRRGGRK